MENANVNAERVQKFNIAVQSVKTQLRRDLVGQDEVVDNVIIAIIAGGNVLLEGVPGVGKTRLVRSLGKTLNLPFSRIQFTPDLMPSDVTGTEIMRKDENGNMQSEFRRGPIFANLVLADEINRATPKTQSAMLEVMQEHKVTVAGNTYKLEEPFFVLATENPIEQDGTYPLPEAQMDRFMFKLIMKFPSDKELMDIVKMTQITMATSAVTISWRCGSWLPRCPSSTRCWTTPSAWCRVPIPRSAARRIPPRSTSSTVPPPAPPRRSSPAPRCAPS